MRLFVLGSFVQACCWSVARLPKAGETFVASGVTIEAGGKGLNVAICTRRLGAEVDIALGVGQDAAAADLLALLQHEGVGVEHVHALAKQSGYGAGLIGADGQNAIAVYPGPNFLLNSQHLILAEASIKAADLVYGQFETSVVAITQAFKIAKKYHVRTVLNPSPWQEISEELLSNTDILIVNEVEATGLFDCPPLDFSKGINVLLAALEVLVEDFYTKWQGQCMVVTLGEHGSVAFKPSGETYYSKPLKIIALDTVGAGDAFASGFCAAMLESKSLVAALEYGNVCGAIVASKMGVLEALPSARQVAEFVSP